MGKRTRQQAGKLAVQHGRFVEGVFDATATQYRIMRTARVVKHFPEYRPGKAARFNAHGQPDRSVFIPVGYLALVECKYVANVNQVTFSERFHQWETMANDVAHYGDDRMAGAYFIYWAQQKEFRLHDHRTIQANFRKRTLAVKREDGKLCKEENGLALWLKPLLACFVAPF